MVLCIIDLRGFNLDLFLLSIGQEGESPTCIHLHCHVIVLDQVD